MVNRVGEDSTPRRTAGPRLRAPILALVMAVVAAVTLGVSALPAQAWADGNTAPTKTLTGGTTRLDSPRGLVFDAAGAMYVTNFNDDSVTVYADGWADGNTAPTKTLTGGATGLAEPNDVAIDAAGTMYIANTANDSVTVYADGWANGNTAPTKTLTGGATGVNGPTGVAIDAAGAMYITNLDNDSVTVYADGWADGDTAPTKTLTGGATGLDKPGSVAIDAGGAMYITNVLGSSVGVYANGWADGDTAPTKMLTGGATGLSNPVGVAIDDAGAMYIANVTDSSVSVYANGWANGDTAPTKTLTGNATGLGAPFGVAFDAAGAMYITNISDSSVTVYAPKPSQTVTFTSVPDVNVGGTGTVTATTDGDGAISYTSSTLSACTVDTSTGVVTGVAAGSDNCTIQAVAAGTTDWLPGSSTQTFNITAAVVPVVAQSPERGCVTAGTSIPRRGAKTLMKPGCVTNADQTVGVQVRSATPRGDMRYYTLFCMNNGKRTATVKAGFGRFRVCKDGQLKIRTYGTPLTIRVTWKANATTGYTPYKKNVTYKT